MISRVEGTSLPYALVVLAAVGADNLVCLHFHPKVLFDKVHRTEDGEIRIPLAAARTADRADCTEGL